MLLLPYKNWYSHRFKIYLPFLMQQKKHIKAIEQNLNRIFVICPYFIPAV